MEYDQLLQSVKKFNFIGNDEQRADAALKAILGIIASRMSEEDAREFTSFLPEPLTLEKLRSHQAHRTMVNPKEHLQIIATQFKIKEDEAQEMIREVLHLTRENLGEERFNSWKAKLPAEWSSYMEQV